MANYNSNELTAMGTGTPLNLDSANCYDARVKRFRASFDLASQASGSTLTLCTLPKDCVPLAILVTPSTSLSTATIKIGTADDDDKYCGAKTFTSADTPTVVGATGATKEALTAEETLIATTGTAALPASGTLVFDVLVSSIA